MRGFYMGKYTTEKSDKTTKNTEKNHGELPHKLIVELCAEARSKAREGYFMGAFKKIDEARAEVFKDKFSDRDRQYVAASLKEILVIRYKDVVIKRYETLVEQYRMQKDDGIMLSLQTEKYPRRNGQSDKEYFESYISSLAIRQIDEDTKDDRYGGKMHVIIKQILDDYFKELDDKRKKEEDLRSKKEFFKNKAAAARRSRQFERQQRIKNIER